MNEKELRENYPPLKVGNQQEFDTWMGKLNMQQSEENVPLNKQKADINRKRNMIQLQMQTLRQQDKLLQMEYLEIEARQKDMNRVYHALKHEMIVLNPKNSAQAE